VKLRQTLAAVLTAVMLLSGLINTAQPAAASQERNPDIMTSLNLINMWRGWLGIAPLTISPSLQKAAEAHVEYYRLNVGDPSLAGMGLHYETKGKPGFTGEDFQDRADAAGYKGWVNENAGLSGSMVSSTKWFIGTIGHRLTLLDPRYTEVGLAAVNQGDTRFEIIDLGAPKWDDMAEPTWAAWPPAGATGVGLSFDGEAPNPFPSASYPVGYPITLKYFGPGELSLASATLSVNGAAIPSFAEIGTGWLSRQTIELCAQAPLTPDTTYTVHIEGTANGQPFTKDWSFTTSSGDDELALAGAGTPPAPVAPTPTPTPAPTPVPEPVVPAVPVDANLPSGVGQANPVIQSLWLETDGPVADEKVARSWLWGPDTWLDTRETSLESADGTRQVYYFDKARMEVNSSDRDQSTYVTAGLLVRDMIVGRIQVGVDEYEDYVSADVPLAGDEKQFNPDAPTYMSLKGVASIVPGREVPQRRGAAVVEVIAQDGTVTTNSSLDGMAAYGSYASTLGHNIASVFDTYLASLAGDWQMSVGLPLTEPYWVQANLKGSPTWVLVQAFERRVLTWTPINRPEWQVEMGNVGRSYYAWRYRESPPE
jgi:hypothetical protein